MDYFETVVFRDLGKFLFLITVGITITFVIVGIYYYIIPMVFEYNEFIINNECLYFKEINQTLCGQDAINYIAGTK